MSCIYDGRVSCGNGRCGQTMLAIALRLQNIAGARDTHGTAGIEVHIPTAESAAGVDLTIAPRN